MKLGKNLKSICERKGLTLTKLAKSSGVPLSSLHGWTTGRKSINPEQIRRVASTLEISIHRLLFDEADPHEQLGQEVLKEIFSGDVRVTIQRIERKRRESL